MAMGLNRVILVALAALASLAEPLAGAEAAAPQQISGARSFAFAIGDGLLRGDAATVGSRFAPFDVVVVDGGARSAEVAAIRSHGTMVLGYLSVGTIERWRSWYRRVKRFRLNPDANWHDEWFADTSQRGYRRVITGRVAPRLLRRGFDGLFLDNVDMIETRDHRAQRRGMKRLVRRLAQRAHRRDRLLFTQNGAWILRKLRMVRLLDGWNREDVTWTYDFDRHRYVRVAAGAHRAAMRELARFDRRGLLTTATDYTAAGDRRARRRSVANACSVGALPYVSNIGLTLARLPDPPLVCP